MLKKPNPHHLDIDTNSSLINLSFASQNKNNMTLDDIVSRTKRKLRLISILVAAIYNKRVANAFHNIKFKPLRTYQLKKRLVEVFLALVRRSDYKHKYQTFQRLKKLSIKQRNQQVKQLQTVLARAKISAVKILGILMKTKERQNIETGFKRVFVWAKKRYQQKCDKYRKGFRIWIKVQNTVLRKHFLKLRSSRYLLERRLKVQSIVKVLREYRERSMKSGIDKLRRNLLRQRQRSIREEIQQAERKLQGNQDNQLKLLKQKQQKLQKSISQTKKQKQQISQAYQTQVKQAQSKNIQIQQRTKQLRQENQKLLQQIKQINQHLNQPYTLNEIYQIFYNNLLYYIAKNRNSTLNKNDMLQSITKPLVPIDIPIDKMKEENKVLKDLVNEYVLIFGPKTLQGREIQIPYEYLVKENQTMYKMLLTLLPNLHYNKKDITQLRDTLQGVETLVKEFKS